jgi:hypothetical protein
MIKYSVLWVDDDLSDSADEDNKKYLRFLSESISYELRDKVDISWGYRKNPEEGAMQAGKIDYRLAVIDYEYKNSDYKIEDLILILEKRNNHILYLLTLC